jgi:hypothetical protein
LPTPIFNPIKSLKIIDIHDELSLSLLEFKSSILISLYTLLFSGESIHPKVHSESIFFLENAKVVATAHEFASMVALYTNYLPLSFAQI